MAEWLNTTFYTFDGGIFNAMHNLAKSAGGFFTPFFKVVSVFGEDGIFFIIASLILMLFKKSRRVGATMLLSIAIGALFTNIVIKNAVARPRPFNDNEQYREFWEYVLAKEQSEYSFPSGHTTATMASMTAIFLCCNKKWSWAGFVFAFFMATSRVYLIVHYTTDVIAGLLVGSIAGIIACAFIKLIYKKITADSGKGICKFILNFDILDLLNKRK